MDSDYHIDHSSCHGDHNRILRLLCAVSGHHTIANVTLPWLLNHLKTISTLPYNDKILEDVNGLLDCIQSIVEHLSVLCNDENDVEYFKPFLLDMLTMFIDPTLDGDHITDPHVLTNSTVLSKCAMSLRVAIQGVNRCMNILEYTTMCLFYCSKMRLATVKAIKHTFWSLIISPDTSTFNPLNVSSPLC